MLYRESHIKLLYVNLRLDLKIYKIWYMQHAYCVFCYYFVVVWPMTDSSGFETSFEKQTVWQMYATGSVSESNLKKKKTK